MTTLAKEHKSAKACKSDILWSDEPLVLSEEELASRQGGAQRWSRMAYPIGNGQLGCTVFGDPNRERVQFNEDSLWVGNEDCTGGYQPFGDLYVELGHSEFCGYRRELDIGRAVQTVSYASGGVSYKREYFSSHPAQLMVFRFTADKPGALSGSTYLGNRHEIPTTAEGRTLTMKGNTEQLYFWKVLLKEPARLFGSREYASDKIIGLDFEAQARVLTEGGAVRTEGNSVVFEGCDTVTILLAADTNFLNRREKGWRGEHPHARLCSRIAAAEECDYAELLAEHVADYQSLYAGLSLDLGETPPELACLPTAQRRDAYQSRYEAKQDVLDRGLELLLYQYARYLMISCSRPGEGALPANLQGLWLYRLHPAWRCDYHTDINVQMNYWFVDQANIGECFIPFAEWVDSIREVRKEETRRVLGVEHGWLMRSENGVFGGSTWHFQKGDSAWLCQNLWDHYRFTQDKAYLQRYAYPVLKEISEFWVDHLKELPDGTLIAPAGRSPEHGPVDVDGVTYDQALCWDLFSNTIAAGEVLDEDAEFREQLKDKRDRLLGPQIGSWGQLQEWMEDIDDPEDDHRHINHLISVYPGGQVHARRNPEIAAAAKVSLCARRDYGEGHPAWSRVWKACMFARLMDAESAFAEISQTLATHIYGNLWAVHPPFQIDANFGYAAAVNEMLVQSHLHVATATDDDDKREMRLIHLLPALPKAWPTGHVCGMRVRGGYEVDVAWDNGALTQASIRNINGSAEPVRVCYGDKDLTVVVSPGAATELGIGERERKENQK